MKYLKTKIGLLALSILVLSFFLWLDKNYVLSAMNCEKEQVNIVLYKDIYYEYQFPIDFVPFCGEVVVKENKHTYVSLYENGRLDGSRKIFYENGKIKLLAHFKNGILEGEFTGWYDNGHQAIKTFYKSDLENGLRTEWYENGAPKKIGHYAKGKKHSEFVIWHDKGNISKNDWKQNSSPKLITFYENDVEKGPQFIFDKNGTVVSKKEF